MKRIGSKGQGAMEYLMTYGWAVMVVVIVGVVLWQLGIFDIPPHPRLTEEMCMEACTVLYPSTTRAEVHLTECTCIVSNQPICEVIANQTFCTMEEILEEYQIYLE